MYEVINNPGTLFEAFQHNNDPVAEWPDWLRASGWKHAQATGHIIVPGDPPITVIPGMWIVRGAKSKQIGAFTDMEFRARFRLYTPPAPEAPLIAPVLGYRSQGQGVIDEVNFNKRMEEMTLRRLDDLKGDAGVDQRWLAIGRTHIEQGWMAVNRALFKPGRVEIEGLDDPQA